MIEIHASAVSRWLSCPQSARHSELNRGKPKKSMPVGQLLGNQVHNEITGHEYTEPNRVIYDDGTPSSADIPKHKESMVKCLREAIEELGLTVEKTEVSMEVHLQFPKEVCKNMWNGRHDCQDARRPFLHSGFEDGDKNTCQRMDSSCSLFLALERNHANA